MPFWEYRHPTRVHTAHCSHPTQPHRSDGQRMKATRTAQKRVSPLPSPHGMSRSFTAIATQRGRRRRIIPRYTVSGISVSTLPNVHRVPIGFLLSIMLHLLLEQLTTHSARAETIMPSLSVFAIWIIPRTLRRSATGYKTL